MSTGHQSFKRLMAFRFQFDTLLKDADGHGNGNDLVVETFPLGEVEIEKRKAASLPSLATA